MMTVVADYRWMFLFGTNLLQLYKEIPAPTFWLVLVAIYACQVSDLNCEVRSVFEVRSFSSLTANVIGIASLVFLWYDLPVRYKQLSIWNWFLLVAFPLLTNPLVESNCLRMQQRAITTERIPLLQWGQFSEYVPGLFGLHLLQQCFCHSWSVRAIEIRWDFRIGSLASAWNPGAESLQTTAKGPSMGLSFIQD